MTTQQQQPDLTSISTFRSLNPPSSISTLPSAPSTTTATPPPTRRPYHGSCHCGHTRYIAYLTLPPPSVAAAPPSPMSTTYIRKCNCTTCHKMGFFHVRLMDSPGDFVLLSPLDPDAEVDEKGGGGLRDYRCFLRETHWYFCGGCGVRCFAFSGEGGVREVVVDWDGGNGEGEGGEGEGEEMEKKKKTVKAWTPKREGWEEGEGEKSYLSINASSLDAGQEGLDLREWTEKGWVSYLEYLRDTDEMRLGRPFEGGMY